MTMADDDGISLRPTLRPMGQAGVTNPFSMFSKGSGQALKTKAAQPPASDTKAKKDEDRVKYSKDFLMQFHDKFTAAPAELLQHSVLNAEIVISEQAEKDQQRQALQKAAEDGGDERDWRTRTASGSPGPAAGKDGAPKQQQQQAQQKPASQPSPPPPSQPKEQQQQQQQASPEESGKIVRAADVGVQAYRPGAAVSAEERASRQIKGILNKLTPEKFERLLQQLLGVVTTADILRNTITLVFENAVEQPTYCALYADLCFQLSKELPSFPPPPGSDKPVTFIQILLNTCQDEFEGAEEEKEKLSSMSHSADREEAERAVKKRVMGTMRLISELYKKEMVRDWIVTTCLEALLAKEKGKSSASEDSIEAACEMLTTAGAKVAQSESEKMRKKLEDVFQQLAALEKDKNLSSRIRFVVRDLLDLKRSHWVPRRETFTARKLDEVRAQAEAELGMVSSVIAASLPVLPAQQRMGPAEDFALIPPLRGDADGWGFPAFGSNGAAGGSGGGAKFGGGQSALLGDFRPPQATVQLVASTTASGPGASGQRTLNLPATPLSEDELKRKTQSLLAEFTSTLDKAEAVLCVRELGAPAFMPQLVEISITTMMECIKDKEVTALEELLLHMHAQGLISTADLLDGLATFTDQLEDVSLDVPKAPSILGSLVGSAVLQSIFSLSILPQLLEGSEFSVDIKREFAGQVFARVIKSAGKDGLAEMCQTAGLTASAFLTADPEIDPDAPAVDSFLKQQGLHGVVPV